MIVEFIVFLSLHARNMLVNGGKVIEYSQPFEKVFCSGA